MRGLNQYTVIQVCKSRFHNQVTQILV